MNKNNWYVITGAPSSGKSTTLDALKKKGYKVYLEWARIYIDSELKKGRTIQKIRKDHKKFQDEILKLKIKFEDGLVPEKVLFMDRGIPDTTAYYELVHLKISPLLKIALKECHYKKVFLLELIKYQTDYTRTESQEEAMLIDHLLYDAYKEIGADIIRVPKMSVEKRVKFILENL